MSAAKSRRLFAIVTMLMVLAMVVTGCGGGGGGTNGGGGTGDLVDVKIGVSSPFTGDVAALGTGIRNGAQMAIEQSAPELEEMGIKLSMLAVDDAADPKTGVNAANQMVSDPAVVGIVGHLNSGVSIPASAVYNEAGVVMVSPAATNPALTLQGFENVFRVCTIDPVQGSYAADFVYNTLGLKSAAVVDDSTPYGEGLAAEFAKAFEALGGKVTSKDKIQVKDQDFQALVTKIGGDKPELIYYGGMYTEAALISKQAKESGFEGPVMGGDGVFSQDFIAIAGPANAEGDLATSVGLPLSQQPQGEEFQAMFDEKFPGQNIEAYDTYSYDAAMVIIEAIKKVAEDLGADKVTTPAGKQAIIEAVAATNMEGVTGKVAFDENGDTTNKAITAYIVRDGDWAAYNE